jgi:enoyl-CoA hydratase/carnithine racemase
MADLVATESTVTTRQDGHIFEITLNRPEKRNAMNLNLMTALDAAIDEAERTDGVRAVIVRGEGKGFSAGIDLMGWQDVAGRFGESWQQNLFTLTAEYQKILNKFERSSLPVILAAHRYCLGMAFELALACDFRIVAEDTKLGLPETKLGLIPDVGGTARLTRLVNIGLAKELIMTGRTFDAAYAERKGIVHYVTPEADLMDKARELADELAQAAPLAVSYAKRVINDVADLDRGLQFEAWAQSVLIRSDDFAEGVEAFITKRAPDWKGR